MKKLLILFALFIFACSSDDDKEVASQKLIKSIELHSFQCESGNGYDLIETYVINYENNRIISSIGSECFFGCKFTETQCSPYFQSYEYSNQKILIKGEDDYGGNFEYLLNEDGLVEKTVENNSMVESNSITKYEYYDGYLIGGVQEHHNGDSFNKVTVIWEDGNLINVDGEITHYYGNLENKSNLQLWAFPTLVYNPLWTFYGKSSKNLPVQSHYKNEWENYFYYYEYKMDNEGYVSSIKIEKLEDGETFEYTLEISYY